MVKATTILLLGASASAHACTAPKSNAATVDLVAEFESFEPEVYLDPVGLQTIGYGHLCQEPKCAEVKYPIPLSVADGKKLLEDDMSIAENCIYSVTNDKVTLNANQYGALVSWAFNVGCGNARSSTLIESLNKGEDPNTVAARELPRWNRSGGVVIPGLTRRRKEELALCKTPTNEPALPACAGTSTTQSTAKPTETNTASETHKFTRSHHTKTRTRSHGHTHTHGQSHTASAPSTLSTVKSTGGHGNSTAAPTSTRAWTTSVVYTTEVHTVTQCPPTVTDCPAGPHVTTKTIALYTTVCPVTETEAPTVIPTSQDTGSSPSATSSWTVPSQSCNGNCTQPAPTSPPPVSSGGKIGVSVALLLGAIMAFVV